LTVWRDDLEDKRLSALAWRVVGIRAWVVGEQDTQAAVILLLKKVRPIAVLGDQFDLFVGCEMKPVLLQRRGSSWDAGTANEAHVL
jgi:hypothetical protein